MGTVNKHSQNLLKMKGFSLQLHSEHKTDYKIVHVISLAKCYQFALFSFMLITCSSAEAYAWKRLFKNKPFPIHVSNCKSTDVVPSTNVLIVVRVNIS